MILYIFQQSGTGARAQAEVIAEHVDDVVLLAGTPLGVENPDEAYTVDEEGIAYATHNLTDAVAAFDPELVLVHIFNNAIISEINQIQLSYPTVMRAGINITENMMSGAAAAMGLGTIIGTLQSFDHIIAPSAATRRDLTALGIDAERVTVIPTTIPFEGRTTEPDVNAPMRVGCLSGRISGLKNQHTLILAIASLRSAAVTPHLLLTGELAQYGQAVRSMVDALGVGHQVEFAGQLPDPETQFWPHVGVHCLPSYSERLSSAVLEGARAGVPTVISQNAWAEPFDAMLTAPPDDPVAWADHLEELLANDAYRLQVAREQQAEIREQFAAEAVAPLYDGLFDELIDDVARFKTPAGAIRR